MANKKSSKKRTQVKDLPRPAEELSADEQKKVQGGTGINPSDNVDATRKIDYNRT